MKADLIDLHIHSNYSDGTQDIEEIIDISASIPLKVISITDHDTIDGINPARNHIIKKQYPLDLITGTELSSKYGNLDVHILGYCFNEEDEQFTKILKFYKEKREERAYKIIDKLSDNGIKLTIELVKSLADGGSIGRPHIARALVQSGAVENIEEAFSRYLGYFRPAYVPKEKMTPEQAIQYIHQAGGIAVLAHSGRYLTDNMLNEFITFGLDGIEVYHPIHDNKTTYNLLKKAKENSLLVTGGSDSHGLAKSDTYIGSIAVPYLFYEKLLDSLKERKDKS